MDPLHYDLSVNKNHIFHLSNQHMVLIVL
ncbi:hypothetical protein D9O40_21635 [Clostridium autoethanogenum]|uniref:Uncharacterized protein n=1 Tax=Clostridium autoethanogenum TaxID=84023 RepID=A0A3M0S064_9CLOT|nr:hypothetical protein D9O40_21635 [Clostridium autoethanogenum]